MTFGDWLADQAGRADQVGALARSVEPLGIVWPPANTLHNGTFSQHHDVLFDAWAARGFAPFDDGDAVWSSGVNESLALLRVAWAEWRRAYP